MTWTESPGEPRCSTTSTRRSGKNGNRFSRDRGNIMDSLPLALPPTELYGRLGTGSAPVLIDARRHDPFTRDDKLIVGAFHRRPKDVQHWAKELPRKHPVVAYCVHGHEVSQGVAAALSATGI